MNVSRINSKPFQHAVLIFQPVNRISYFLSAFSFLYWTATLLSFQKAIVHKIYRQTIEQGHQTGTGLLSHFSPLLNPTQAIYGTFILFQSLNAYPLCSLRHWIQKPTQNQCYPDIFPSRLYTNQNAWSKDRTVYLDGWNQNGSGLEENQGLACFDFWGTVKVWKILLKYKKSYKLFE